MRLLLVDGVVLMLRRRAKRVLMLALPTRMRLLARVLDIVVPYLIVVRHGGFDTWVPARAGRSGRWPGSKWQHGRRLERGRPLRPYDFERQNDSV